MTSKVLINRYELKEKIGYGGMGQVYLGWDRLLNRLVAVKLMPNYDEQLRERYRREAASLASLSHPNIIKIYDVGEDAGVIFIVMEYIQGRTLREIIKEKAPLPLNEGLNLIQKVLKGLAEVHGKGIIHRDIKPQNILVTDNLAVKLCDFGIAKVLTSQTMTVTGMALGTVQYMAPEQLMGGAVYPATDIYSIGVILYEIFTGQLPFNGNNIGEIAQKHFNIDPPAVRDLNPKINRDLELLIIKCLAKKHLNRFQRVEEILRILEGIIDGNLKDTVMIGMKQNPPKTLYRPTIILNPPKNNLAKFINPTNHHKLKKLLKIPLRKIVSLGILLFLIFGIHNYRPWIEDKTKELVKQSLLSRLRNEVPILNSSSKSNKKTVKNEVEKVKDSLQILQKDAGVLTDKEILRKLEDKLNEEYNKLINKAYSNLNKPKINNKNYPFDSKERLEKQYKILYEKYIKDYQKNQGKKAKRKHDD